MLVLRIVVVLVVVLAVDDGEGVAWEAEGEEVGGDEGVDVGLGVGAVMKVCLLRR